MERHRRSPTGQLLTTPEDENEVFLRPFEKLGVKCSNLALNFIRPGAPPEFLKNEEMERVKHRRRNKQLSQIIHKGNQSRLYEKMEDLFLCPDTMPFLSQKFKPSRIFKKVPFYQKLAQSFEEMQTFPESRGFMLHTDRYHYQWKNKKKYGLVGFKYQLQMESEIVGRLPGMKKRQIIPPHTSDFDLKLGGKKIEMEERFNLNKEIQQLKSLILPKDARDLFHGRGFKLPLTHGSIKPRKPIVHDCNSPASAAPACHQKMSANNDVQLQTRCNTCYLTGKLSRRESSQVCLSRLDKQQTFTGHPTLATPAAVKLSKQRHNMKQLKSRLNVSPSANSNVAITRSHTTVLPILEHTNRSPQLINSISLMKTEDRPKKVQTNNFEPQNTGSDRESIEIKSKREPGVSSRIDTETSSFYQSLSMHNSSSPEKIASTSNPFMVMDLSHVTADEQESLMKTFKHLDTDMDGHIMYAQLKSHLPSTLSQAQEKYIKVVYDISNSNTFFGVSEFLTMSQLTKLMQNLGSAAQNAYEILDFTTLKESIVKYMELFQSNDRGQKGKIYLSVLPEMLSSTTGKDFTSESKNLEEITVTDGTFLKKMEFLAHIPYFLSLEN